MTTNKIPAPGDYSLIEVKDRAGRTWTAILEVVKQAEHFGRIDLVVRDPFGDPNVTYKTTVGKLRGIVDKSLVAAIIEGRNKTPEKG